MASQPLSSAAKGGGGTGGGTGGGAQSSTLSTDSPPFNPRGLTTTTSSVSTVNGGIGRSSPGPGVPPQIRSKNNSPVPSASNSANGSGGAGPILSNAVSKHTFQNPATNEPLEIRNVWADNVEAEMAVIRELVETHPYVAMDTEFPGVVVRPVSETYSPDYHYKSLKCNVDLLKIIQLGLSFADEEGNLARGCPCWQFNFKWSLGEDIFAQDSIDLLVNSGISFDDHATRGIDPLLFGELLMVSGLVLDDQVQWVSYHSGYDYAYLLKILTTRELPPDEKGFFELLKTYFPTIYDIKYMTSLCDGHFGGLQKLADDLQCPRIGSEHQAGSDSLLTMTTYFALVRAKFASGGSGNGNGNGQAADDSRYRNELYGYGSNHTVYKGRGGYSSQQSGSGPTNVNHSDSSGALSSMNGNDNSH